MKKAEPDDVVTACFEPNMAVNGPVFFLIREQAKSIVAIKELQVRLTVLEDLQERLMQAVQNIQHHLIYERASGPEANIRMNSNSVSDSETNTLAHDVSPLSQKEGKQEPLSSATTTKSFPRSESINKDSGLGSEYKDRSSDCSYVPFSENSTTESKEDELLKLLDIIDEKSLVLLQQIGDINITERTVGGINDDSQRIHNDLPSCEQTENVIMQRQLCEVKADRDALKQRLASLELATDAVMVEKKSLQKKLENVISENRQLQKQIQDAGDFKQLCTAIDDKVLAKSSLAEIEKASVRRKYLQYSEKSRKKVIHVLKETSLLELQRQLLTYIMENDVLQAKLDQLKPAKVSAWLKIEARLKKDLRSAREEINRLEETLQEKEVEVSILRNRIKVLEETLDQDTGVKNFGLNSNDDWRQYGGAGNLKQNTSAYSPLALCDFSKTQSLPATMQLTAASQEKGCNNTEGACYFSPPRYGAASLSANSFYDNNEMNFHSHSYEETNKDNILLDLTDCNESVVSDGSNTMHSGYWNQPVLSAEWSRPLSYDESSIRKANRLHWSGKVSPVKQMNSNLANGHLCWKSSIEIPANDLDSICTEFDPLSGAPSCENFVDSLNLSIPLRPTPIISQLSSAGDSLHSASLDLGGSSSAIWHPSDPKLPSSCSADGTRLSRGDTNISGSSKHRTQTTSNLTSSITSVISGRTNRTRPANISECVNSFTNQKLI